MAFHNYWCDIFFTRYRRHTGWRETDIRLMFTIWYKLCANSWWRHQMETFSVLLVICAAIHRSPVNSPHKGQWRQGALMFSLILARTNGWVNNSEAGDLIRHRAHYDVILMLLVQKQSANMTSQWLCSTFLSYHRSSYVISWWCRNTGLDKGPPWRRWRNGWSNIVFFVFLFSCHKIACNK